MLTYLSMLRFFGQFFVKSEAKLDVLRMHIQPRERLQQSSSEFLQSSNWIASLALAMTANLGVFWTNCLKLTPMSEGWNDKLKIGFFYFSSYTIFV